MSPGHDLGQFACMRDSTPGGIHLVNDYLATNCLSPLEMLPFLTISGSPYNRNNERGEPSKMIPELPSSKTMCHPLELFSSLPLLMIEISAFNCPCRNLRHWSFPICPLFHNPPFYASSHLLDIVHQSKDQNPPLFLTPQSSPVFGGLNFWNNNPLSQRWC